MFVGEASEMGKVAFCFFDSETMRASGRKHWLPKANLEKTLLSESSASLSLGGSLMGHDYEKLKLAEQTWLKDFQEVMRFTSRN